MDVATLSLSVDSTGITSASKAMEGMTSVGRELERVVKQVAAAFGLYKLSELIKDSATLSARYETLGVVMGVVGNNAGYSRAQMDQYATALEKTGISMVGARDSLTMMAGAQMDLTKSSQMARMAQDAAVIGNINSSEAFQRMTQGIRSGETEILRTIGISVNFEQAYAKLAGTLHKTTKDLTDVEKLTARQNVVLEYGSKIAGAYEASMGTAGKQLLSMTRYAEDLQTVFGALFSDAFGVVVQTLNQALADTKKWLVENAEAAETMRNMLGSAAKNFVGLVTDVLGLAADMSKVSDEFSFAEIAAGYLAGAMAIIRDAVMAIIGVVQTLWGAISTLISGAIYGFTKLIGMAAGFQPPAWMKTFLDSSKGIFNAGGQNLQGGSISTLISGGDWMADFQKEQAAKESAARSEDARINEGKSARKVIEDKAKADLAAAAGAAAYAAALQHKIDVMKFEAKAYDQVAEAASKHADAGVKDTLALQDFVTSLQPAKVEAEKMAKVQYDLGWALADGIINQREYNELLGIAATEFTAAGQAAEDYKAKAKAERERVTDQFLTPQEAFKKDKSRFGVLGLDIETYKRAIASIDPVWTDTFGSMRATLDDFSKQGTDAFVEFCWSGKASFSDLVSSMLRDLARLTVQKNVMGPLFEWIGSGISAWAGSGGGESVHVGTNLGTDSIGPIPTVAKAPSSGSGSAMVANINVTVNSDGSTKSTTDAGAQGKAIARDLQNMMDAWGVKNMRTGGLLNPVST